jgi:maltooligosyltrehalose trehalohydrolase
MMLTTVAQKINRKLPIGAEIVQEGSVHFRVWAPKPRKIELVLRPESSPEAEGESIELEDEGTGYRSVLVEHGKAGMRYGYRLNDGDQLRPDPATRFQPDGPAGLSQIVDPRSFHWSDGKWKGKGPFGHVLYEMHIGTFTKAGTFAAAANELPELKRIGITTIELMPVSDFPGRFGWGYDGVNMFAPSRLYGVPDDFRAFVDRAHQEGLAVVLDVVYNHFGNVDNYLYEFADNFKSACHQTEWADAINFDGENCQAVREFFAANARYWIDEFHLDGFRYDATQSIFDDSTPHILAVCNQAARAAAAASGRQIFLAAENEPEDVRCIQPGEQGGFGMDAIWNDDFHHSARVRMTDSNPAYYSDFQGTAQELAAAIKRSFIYQGQRSAWQEKPRGTPTRGLPAAAFISFIQNHDQVANSATGQRILELTSPGRYRAMTALWLLAPQTPLFFQGQEFASSSPFLFFADFTGDMAKAIAKGRGEFMSQFPHLETEEAQRILANPCDPIIFERCKLDLTERTKHQPIYDLHIDLLKLRHNEPVFSRQSSEHLETATLNADCLVVRYFDDSQQDRLVVANFGRDLHYAPVAEPLLAPPAGCDWEMIWNSNMTCYGGAGMAPVEIKNEWFISGEATIVMAAVPAKESTAAGTDPDSDKKKT